MIRGLAATSELVKVLRLQTKQLGPVTTRWLSQQQSDSGPLQVTGPKCPCLTRSTLGSVHPFIYEQNINSCLLHF